MLGNVAQIEGIAAAPTPLSLASKLWTLLPANAPSTASIPASPILLPETFRLSNSQNDGNKADNCNASASLQSHALKSSCNARRCSSHAWRNLLVTKPRSRASLNSLLSGPGKPFNSSSQRHNSSEKRSALPGGDGRCLYLRRNAA